MLVPRRFLKTNIAPDMGSDFNTVRHSIDKPSIPRRKSTGSVARRILIWGVI
jgi:hypothetical protein